MCLHFISCWYTIFSLHISDLNYVEEVKGYTISQQGHAVLVDQRNFTYMVHKKAGTRTFWRCRKYRKRNIISCNARASTYQNYIMKLSGIHNHDPDDITEMLKTENDFSC